jgi:phosphoribosylamine--glycine ligase
VVVKADGLAAGKGVTVCTALPEAEQALREAMVDKAFGDAGAQVVVEEYLEGEEASILAFTDGETLVPMPSAQDHKRVLDGDRGPNTGGMGAYSPAPVVTPAMSERIHREILSPTLEALRKRGIVYQGVLYAGLMITREGPKVIEYNCRFGDPETQVLLPRLKSDLVGICLAVAQVKLSHLKVEWDRRPAATVVMASKGYPGSYPKGLAITGLEEASRLPDTHVYHAGTTSREGRTLTAGGRVLSVTGVGDDLRQALDRAYAGVGCISFEGAHHRKDIGWRAMGGA